MYCNVIYLIIFIYLVKERKLVKIYMEIPLSMITSNSSVFLLSFLVYHPREGGNVNPKTLIKYFHKKHLQTFFTLPFVHYVKLCLSLLLMFAKDSQ